MDFGKNPLLESTIKHKLETVYNWFPSLEKNGNENIVSLYDYLQVRPLKFYSKKVFHDYFEFLSNLAASDVPKFKDIVEKKESTLNIAFRTLARINSDNIHDVFPPSNEIERIRFIDKKIHYNYQRLVEGVYHALILPIAIHLLGDEGNVKKVISIYECNNLLKKSDFSHLTNFYDNVVRNSIAHDDLEYRENEVLYRNNKNEKVLHSKEIINLFDNLLDVCNGMAFAFKTFVLANFKLVSHYNIKVPKWIIIEELMTNLNNYEWEVQDLFESSLLDGKTQLNIYGKNSLLHHQEALAYSFQTVFLTEKFLAGYDSYYISSDSKFGWLCFGRFNGVVLKTNRIEQTNNYQDVVNGVLFFHPTITIPSFLIKLRRMYFSFKTEAKYVFGKLSKKKYAVRWTSSHRNKNNVVVKGSVVIMDSKILEESIVRNNLKSITNDAIRNARKNTSFLKREKYLPVGYLSLSIYSEDRRLRDIKHSGLNENLVCTVEVKKLKRINSPDILNSKIETKGKYRIAWNSNSPVFERVK